MTTGQQNEFINYVASIALQDAPKYDIKVVSPIIAQAIIESRWGQSGLAQKGMNLFGIKCGSKWKGESINMQTKEEYTAGTLTDISANFRKYPSWDDSIHDYFEFINTKRYAALKDCKTPIEYCNAIKAAGYATSSTYVETLMTCINTYDLAYYDQYVGQEIEFVNVDDKPVEVPPMAVDEPKPVTSVIDYSKVVADVINNLYGNGDERIINLAKAGYNPNAIQYMVNLQVKLDNLTTEFDKIYNVINTIKEALK